MTDNTRRKENYKQGEGNVNQIEANKGNPMGKDQQLGSKDFKGSAQQYGQKEAESRGGRDSRPTDRPARTAHQDTQKDKQIQGDKVNEEE